MGFWHPKSWTPPLLEMFPVPRSDASLSFEMLRLVVCKITLFAKLCEIEPSHVPGGPAGPAPTTVGEPQLSGDPAAQSRQAKVEVLRYVGKVYT